MGEVESHGRVSSQSIKMLLEYQIGGAERPKCWHAECTSRFMLNAIEMTMQGCIGNFEWTLVVDFHEE